MNQTIQHSLSAEIVEAATEWAIMHGVAIKNSDNTARHCPFSFAPVAIEKEVYDHLLKVTPLITKLISRVSEDHDFLQSSLKSMSKADPFFERLMSLHEQAHGVAGARLSPARQPLLLMRTDFMDDRVHGAKVIEFNGIAAGMGPFGQRITELHQFVQNQWPEQYKEWVEDSSAQAAPNHGLQQLALGIANAARQVHLKYEQNEKPTFLMIVQKDEDNVYDQHLLELELQKLGLRTFRRTFEQLSSQLSTGKNSRLLLEGIGGVDVVYLRAGYQYVDYCAPLLDDSTCCHTLSQTRLFIEKHNVALNATISQQLATSKSMQMLLTMMPSKEYSRWEMSLEEADLVKSVLAEMKPVNAANIEWFNHSADKEQWVLKNQGEGGGHCIFGDAISSRLEQLSPEEYDAWALMQRLYPHERDRPALAIRDANSTRVDNLVSEIGLFTAFFNGAPVTDFDGYAGYLIRSKPASENEGGVHSGMGVLDSLTLKE